MDALSPEAEFSWSLKIHGDVAFDEGNKKQRRRAVVHFDDAKLIEACSPS